MRTAPRLRAFALSRPARARARDGAVAGHDGKGKDFSGEDLRIVP